MRNVQDARKRWDAIFGKYKNTTALKLDIALGNGDDPCLAGLRSVCWKLFLLFPDFSPADWLPQLRKERDLFAELRAHYLKPFQEGFDPPDVDPLAEDDSVTAHALAALPVDAANPWTQFRRDEELRQEILQDVERCMPENQWFREPTTQKSLLDVLYVYCKLNEDVSYRQGFHEICAVVLWVVNCDAIRPAEECAEADGEMREALDADYVEHDTFALFQCVMRSAKPWYELGPSGDAANSPIVLKSKHIHDTLLMAVDPELSEHLQALDVLPQIFLIRWIRLLFGREFPFEELLHVWDRLFAEDPDLLLVDLMCLAMLLRVRWELLKADYSIALTILLRYPSPSAPNLPSTFVEDAIYLRDNLTLQGGRQLIQRYSGRPPVERVPPKPVILRTQTRSPGGSKPWQPANLETIVQDFTRTVNQRSVQWGVKQALVEVRKNVAGYQQQSPQPQQQLLAATREEELIQKNLDMRKRIEGSHERNRQLARVLELGMDMLDSPVAPDREKAISRMRHVKECLLDPSKPLDMTLLSSSPPKPQPPPQVSFAKHAKTIHIPSSPPPGGFVQTSFKTNSDPDFLTMATSKHRPRASLAQSSFSWMLGDDPLVKNKSGFVASKEKGRQSSAKEDAQSASGSRTPGAVAEEDEGFTLNTLGREMKG